MKKNILLSVFLLLMANTLSFAQVTSFFTATTDCSGNTQFYNHAEAGCLYEWDFGDGSTSTDLNPAHTYAEGTYTAQLLVLNGVYSATYAQSIVVDYPDYVLHYPALGCVGTELALTVAGAENATQIEVHALYLSASASSSMDTIALWSDVVGIHDFSVDITDSAGCVFTIEGSIHYYSNGFTSEIVSTSAAALSAHAIHTTGDDGICGTADDYLPSVLFPDFIWGDLGYSIYLGFNCEPLTPFKCGFYTLPDTVQIFYVPSTETYMTGMTIAGETYTDTNSSGNYEIGEPFVDINGNGSYDEGLDVQAVYFDTICPHKTMHYCFGNSYSFMLEDFNAGTDEVASYEWSVSNAAIIGSDTSAELNLKFDHAGLVTITCLATNAAGCSWTSTTELNIPAPVDISCTATDACLGSNSLLNITGGTGMQLSWYTDTSFISNEGSTLYPLENLGTQTFYCMGIDSYSCRDIDTLTATAMSSAPLILDCISTRCSGDEQTYTLTGGTSNEYLWQVQNAWMHPDGNVSDTIITVTWYDEPIGTITATDISAGASCPLPMTYEISLLSPNMHIAGDTVICAGADYSYTVPALQGVNYVWSTSAGLTMVSTHGNAITVNASTNGEYFIYLYSYHPFLDCDQMDTLRIVAKPRIAIDHTIACPYAEVEIFATPGFGTTVYDWTLEGANISSTSTSSTTSGTWYEPGLYHINLSTTGTDYCESTAQATLQIIDNTNLKFTGDAAACASSTSIYLPSDDIYSFSALSSGSASISASASDLIMTWNASGSENISVFYEVIEHPQCKDTLVFPVDVYDNTPIELTAVDTVCVGDEIIVRSNVFDERVHHWYLNAANILSPTNSDSVLISYSSEGIYKVVLKNNYCSQADTIFIYASPTPNIKIVEGDLKCPGEGIDLIAKSSTLLPYDLIWNTGATTDTIFTTVPDTFTAIATSAYGCMDTAHFATTVPSHTIVPTTIEYLGAIYGPLYVVAGFALPCETENEYVWSDGSTDCELWVNRDTLDPVNYFWVEITDSNGCVQQDTIILYVIGGICTSSTPSPPDCSDAQSFSEGCAFTPDFIYSTPTCDPVSFESLTPAASCILWEFGDENFGSGELIDHYFDGTGTFSVTMTAVDTINLCWENVTQIVTVDSDIKTKFTLEKTCEGVILHDLSTSVLPLTTHTINWGDGITTNYPDTIHNYTATGDYTITIQLGDGLCSYTKEKVFHHDHYAPTLTVVDTCLGAPTQIYLCAENITDAAFSVEIDSATFYSSHVLFEFENSGFYTISATYLIDGCTYNIEREIEIIEPVLRSLNSDFDNTLCSNVTGNISLNSDSLLSNIWSTGATGFSLDINTTADIYSQFTDLYGCKNYTDTIEVKAFENHLLSSSANEFCAYSSSTSLSVSPKDYHTLAWYHNGVFIGNEDNLILTTDLQSGDYYAILTDTVNACTDTTNTIPVNILPLPYLADSISHHYACYGNPVTIDISGIVGSYDYVWSNQNIGLSYSTLQAEIGQVTLIDNNDCKNTLTYIIDYNVPYPFDNFPQGCYTICPEVPYTLDLPNIEPYHFLWSDGSTSNQFTTMGAGDISVTVTDGFCTYTSPVLELSRYEYPVLEITGDTIVCTNESVTFSATPGFEAYYWNGILGTNTVVLENIFADQDFTLTVITRDSCVLTRHHHINLVDECFVAAYNDMDTLAHNLDTLNITILGNDVTNMASSVTVSIIEPPLFGTVTVESDGSITYISNNMMAPVDSFMYTIISPEGYSDTAIIYIYQTIVTSIDQSHFYIDENCDGNTIFFENDAQNPCEKMILSYSKDGIHFENIHTFSCENTNLQSYKDAARDGVSYYQIQQYNFDKSIENSSVKIVSQNCHTALFTDIYPNPTQDVLNINWYNAAGKKGVLYVRDLTGKILLNKEITIATDVQKQSISLQDFSAGMYFIELEIEHEYKHVEKFILIE